MEAGEAGIRASRCIFIQAFRALHHKDPRLLRSCWDGDRVFQVRRHFFPRLFYEAPIQSPPARE